MPRRSTLTLRLLQALRARGATEIFGIPGDFALPLFREIERAALLPLVTLSHEPAVGFAADAAARVRGGLGVAAVTYGAGALNLVNAVASAYAERVPLVVLSGAPAANERASGLQLHHQVKTVDSQWLLFREITIERARLDDAASAPAQIAHVLDTALRRARPVYLEIPRDMPAVGCGAVPTSVAPQPDPEAVAACAEELLERLRAARRPVLMVGVEVRRFGLEPQVAELARRLAVPVVTSFMGRGLLAHADAPLRGTYLGLAGDPVLSELVENSDGLLLLGVILSDTNFAVSTRRIDLRHTLHAFDDQVAMGHHVYPFVPLSALLSALLSRLPPAPATIRRAGDGGAPDDGEAHHTGTDGREPGSEPGAGEAGGEEPGGGELGGSEPGGSEPGAGDREGAGSRTGLEGRRDDAPLLPADIAEAVNALLRREGPMPITSDVGDCLFTAMDLDPTTLLAPGYYATMGYGVPAGLGVQVATGQRPLVLVGDGAFQMTGWELGNARRAGCDPIVVVFNNGAWEMLRAFEPEGRFNALDRWDLAAMAAGMGGDGYAVQTRAELRRALATAHATRGRFQLIDVRLGPLAVSPTLSRFVAAVRRLSAPRPPA